MLRRPKLILIPKLTATLNAQTNDITNVGNMTGLVHNPDIREFDGLQKYLTLEMGEATSQFTLQPQSIWLIT